MADSTKLEGYTDAFDTVIDSGLFHSLDDDGRRSYAAAVHRATRPGATLLLSCFSDANPVGEDWRPAVSEETLRDVLGGAGWDITSLEPATLPGELDGAASRNGVLVPPSGTALKWPEGRYLVRPDTIADNEHEQSSRKIVKCRVLADHQLVTVRGCPRHNSARGLPSCGSSCG